MKKALIILLSMLFVGILPVQAITFSDIDTIASDLRVAVQTLADQGVIQGYGDGTFRPNWNITEKEWALLVLRPLRDNPDVSMYSDKPILRLDALKLLAASWHLNWQNESQVPVFNDIVGWQDNSLVNFFYYAGVIRGRTTTEFGPSLTMTRAEAAKILLLAKEFWQPQKGTLLTPTPTPTTGITQNVVQIVDVVPLTLSPGQTGSILFVIKNNNSLQGGMVYQQDYVVSVLEGNVSILGSSEIGNGLYQIIFKASAQSGQGNINIQITVFLGSVYRTDINEFLRNRQVMIQNATISLARLIPSVISSGNEAQIVVTPQDHNGNPVTGLDVSAEIIKGPGTITVDPVETPAGSGVYLGTYKAGSSVSGTPIEILIRLENIASRPQTIIYGTIK